jgi:hypothetical protein
LDLAFWACWLVGLGVLVHRIRMSEGADRVRWLEIAALALPVASLAFYRNSFTYFYQFILASGSVLVALTWQALSHAAAFRPEQTWPVVLKAIALLWCFVSLLFNGIYLPTTLPLEPQREILAVVHRVFPTPVRYLDAVSMVASFPQVGFFMSSWGMEAYVDRGAPVFKDAIEHRQPPLLLANHPLLDLEHVMYPALQYRQRLLVADLEALGQAYIHHWGPIYVAGKRIGMGEGEGPDAFDLPIAGRYTLEGVRPIRIDSRLTRPGQTVDLARGAHIADGLGKADTVTLRWADALFRPDGPPPQQVFYLGF